MSSIEFKLDATARTDLGKGASRRLRRNEGKLPAIIYGAGKEPQSISIIHKDLWRMQEEEAFYTSILTLVIDGKEEQAVIKDLNRHPAKSIILHADFLRVDANTELTVNVPLHFTNEETCKGVKIQGGIVNHNLTELEVRCLPKDLPEYIEVDMAEYEIGDVVHISDVTLPSGVESVALSQELNLTLAQIIKPRSASDDEAADSAAADDAAPAEDEGASEE